MYSLLPEHTFAVEEALVMGLMGGRVPADRGRRKAEGSGQKANYLESLRADPKIKNQKSNHAQRLGDNYRIGDSCATQH